MKRYTVGWTELRNTDKKPKIMILGVFHMRHTPDLIKGKQNNPGATEGNR